MSEKEKDKFIDGLERRYKPYGEIDKSDWKTENPKMFEYDSKNKIVDIFVREDLKCPFPFHKDDWYHQGLYLQSFVIYVNDLFDRYDLPYMILKDD